MGGHCPACGKALVADARIFAGRYLLLKRLGEGGMGEVWEALEPQVPRTVAIKKLSAKLRGREALLALLRAEGGKTALLRHPNVVVLHGVSDYGEEPYLCMELLRGETMTALLAREGRLPIARVRELLLPVAEAVALAHQHNIEHYDLKPDNLFIDRQSGKDLVKILDFGISKARTGATSNSIIEESLGTPGYAAPEQLTPGACAIPGRSDVFSLGVTLYEALSGHLPFKVSTLLAAARPPTMLHRSDIPKPLSYLLQRMLHGDPSARPTMADVAAALAEAPAPPRRRLALGVAVGLGALGALLVAFLVNDLWPPQNLHAQALRVLQQGVENPEPSTRKAAQAGLLLAGEGCPRALVARGLQDPDSKVQEQAAQVLARLGGPKGALLAAPLDGRPLFTKLVIGGALLQLEDRRDVPRLLEALSEDVASPAPLLAARRLAEAREPAGVDRLKRWLRQLPLLPPPALLPVRRAILESLFRAGDVEAAGPLQRLLEVGPPAERLATAAFLSRAGDEEAQRRLRDLASKGSERLEAAVLLARFYECPEDTLFRDALLGADRGPAEQGLALEGLGRCGKLPQDEPMLRRFLSARTPEPLRLLAAGAVLRLTAQLARLDGGLALNNEPGESLLGMLLGGRGAADLQDAVTIEHDPAALRRMTEDLRYLGGVRAAPALLTLLRRGDDATRLRAAAALRRLLQRHARELDPEITALRALLKGTDGKTRVIAGHTLDGLPGEIDPDGAQVVRAGLKDQDEAVRRLAVTLLPESNPGLIEALQDSERAIRFLAARRLALRAVEAPPQAIKELNLVLLRGGADGPMAYAALRRQGVAAATPKELAADWVLASLEQRFVVVSIAADLPTDLALPYLRQGLFDPSAAVRRMVAESAFRLVREQGNAAALRILQALRDDNDLTVQRRVLAMLLELRDEPSIVPRSLPAAPAQPPPKSPKSEGQATLIVKAEAQVRFLVDAKQYMASANPMELSLGAGRHELRYGAKMRTLSLKPGDVRLETISVGALAQQLLHDAREARQKEDFSRTDALLQAVQHLLNKSPEFSDELAVEKGLLEEALADRGARSQHMNQALSQYRAVVEGMPAHRHNQEALVQAQQGVLRVELKLGLVPVTICCAGMPTTTTMRPTGKLNILVCGKRQEVRVVAGAPTRLGTCPDDP